MSNSKEKFMQLLQGLPVELVAVDDIMDDPMNPNVMTPQQLDALEKSLIETGNVGVIVINRVKKMAKPYMIVNGHQRLGILRKYGVSKVNAVIIEKSLAEARAFGLAFNRNIGEDDPAKRAAVFNYLQQHKRIDLVPQLIPHMNMDFINMTLQKYNYLSMSEDSEKKIELPKKPKSRLGDMYQLGRHRIICGDSTDKATYDRLTRGAKIDQMATDPPYGVNYSESKESFLNDIINPRGTHKGISVKTDIQNDNLKDYREFFRSFLSVIEFSEYNTCYIFISDKEMPRLRLAADDVGMSWFANLIWKKNQFVFGRGDYKYAHEPIFYGCMGKHMFYGQNNETTILEFNKPTTNDLHPTQKPVELVAKLLRDGSQENMVVYDPFLGSGSTLMACEHTNRICLGIEKEPIYIDVIIQRWENLTGMKAVKL